ncbi:MAG: arginine--tRNA ligase [Bacteroidota bacterium]
MSITVELKGIVSKALNSLYELNIPSEEVLVNGTKPEFKGDYTIVLFAYTKPVRKSPEVIGNELGNYLLENHKEFITGFNVIKGFLNLSIADSYWLGFLQQSFSNSSFGKAERLQNKVMVEYSSPNTNKPLHLGHLRNNFLGWSIGAVLNSVGYDVVKTCIVNDRGVHICKSMIAWQLFGNGATPASTNTKGDHFVGDYYVKFNDEYKLQVKELIAAGKTQEEAEKEAPIMKATQQMLIDWEAGKPAVMELWKTMNGWVYEGFDTTYNKIGSDFDKTYYESNTYLLGKDLVEQGLEKKVFFQKDDGSVWIDLTADGLDEKLVRRKDGTSVYITQDIGLAEQKQKEFGAEKSIYVVGDEQNYHFKVLKLICEKLRLPSAEGIYHLSYGMVELPTGKMKSREGTVVDADDLVDEMIAIAAQKTEELGKVKDFTAAELEKLHNIIGLGALKFFLLRVDPKKKMIFNPEESIDFHGFTGPFIQYTHARIKSILRKFELDNNKELEATQPLLLLEKQLIIHIELFGAVLQESAADLDPSKLAVYIFNLVKLFNSLYAEHSFGNAESEEKKILRLKMAQLTATVIKTGMNILGIEVPERM